MLMGSKYFWYFCIGTTNSIIDQNTLCVYIYLYMPIIMLTERGLGRVSLLAILEAGGNRLALYIK